MPYWEEMTPEQRVDQLADVVRMLSREVKQQAEIIMDLTQHTHNQDKLVVPLRKEVCDIPYWLKDPLRNRPR